MKMTQVADLVNQATQEALGEVELLKEDLTNVVDFGKQILSSESNYDQFTKKLANRIGITIFVNRAYSGKYPDLIMTPEQFGSVKQKISGRLNEAEDNQSWNLVDGQEYNRVNTFYQPDVIQKFFNDNVTFDIPQSIAQDRVVQSFSSASELNAFVSMLYNEVEKSLTVKLDRLVQMLINSMIGLTITNAYTTTDFTGVGNGRAVNLLANYKVINPTSTLTKDTCLYDKDFILFAVSEMTEYFGYLKEMSTLFNVGGEARFTPDEYRRFIFLNKFVKQADFYLNSSTFHDNYVKLPTAYKIGWWQGSGTELSFDSISAIDIKFKDPTTNTDKDFSSTGILACVFDMEALAVSNISRKVTNSYNADGDFYNYFHKYHAGYFADHNENFIVFFIQ